jgi:hypothetical protein
VFQHVKRVVAAGAGGRLRFFAREAVVARIVTGEDVVRATPRLELVLDGGYDNSAVSTTIAITTTGSTAHSENPGRACFGSQAANSMLSS